MRKIVGLTLLVMCMTFECIGQMTPIKGKVMDENGYPVENATVSVKQKRSGGATITTADGSFSLLVKPGSTLVISTVGYNTQEVPAAAGVIVKLHSDARNLGDVVVTGVGVATSKKMVEIEVATVSSKDFAKSATVSLDQALDGQIAGAQVPDQRAAPGLTSTSSSGGSTPWDKAPRPYSWWMASSYRYQ